MPNKNLVIYHYFEKDASYRDNLLHFLTFGISKACDYFFVVSGECSLDLPRLTNVRYIFTESKKSDFGGYAQLINQDFELSFYQNIFFINSSVRGPYTPPYHTLPWEEGFLQQMVGDVGMVGASICILKSDFRHSLNYQARFGGHPPYSHVQTMAYVLKKEALDLLIAEGFYQEDRDANKTLAIENYEIHLSRRVLALGFDLACLLPEFNRIDYRLPYCNPNPTSTVGDPHEVLGYFGRSVHPYESIFIKTNRHLYTEPYLNLLAYSMWQSQKDRVDNLAVLSPAIDAYLQKLQIQASSGQAVSDFSYFPGFIQGQQELVLARQESLEIKQRLLALQSSRSWRLTKPFRELKDWFSKKA